MSEETLSDKPCGATADWILGYLANECSLDMGCISPADFLAITNAIHNHELEQLGWRPIETAPKSDLHVIISGRYANGRKYVEESYWDPRGHWSARKLEPPTHWMPMPTPPQR